MQNIGTVTKHALIIMLSFVVLYVLTYLSFNLKQYISANEINMFLIYVPIIISCVLLSYVFYLLMASKTKAELVATEMTRSLYASLAQLRSIYEDAPVPYLTLDNKGNILDPNKAALRFFGVVPEEIQGKNIFRYQPEEDLEKAEKFMRYYKANIPINREEIKMITKNGKTRWVLLSVFKMEGPTKNGRSGLATIFDITEQKKLDRAKTEFVSLASHQLRTPVAAVKWQIDMLLSGEIGEFSDKQKDYLTRVHKVNEDMIELIDTLLNISRIEIGSLKMELKPTNVPLIFESVLAELSYQIDEKNLNIEKQYNDNLKNIESDPKFLRIVIQNLITNAVKYTPNDGTITITLKQSFGEKAIIVSDTGVGIPKGEQDKIFTKLFRADNVRSLVGSQGTGLGLYLIKSIVEAMGGGISFVSEENKGSTFVVKF